MVVVESVSLGLKLHASLGSFLLNCRFFAHFFYQNLNYNGLFLVGAENVVCDVPMGESTIPCLQIES